MRNEIIEIVKNFLKENKQPFFNERNLQLYLAKEFTSSGYNVQMECLVTESDCDYVKESSNKKLYIDIVVEKDGKYMPIELKYKTINTDFESKTTLFGTDKTWKMKHQGAQNLGRYWFWRDVERIENISDVFKTELGIAIIVTNDRKYWDNPKDNSEASYVQFSLKEGRYVTSKKLEWAKPSNSSENGKCIKLSQNEYNINWEEMASGFKYLILPNIL